MKKLSTLLLILLSHFCFSQNLVPNPSFEQFDTCPNTLDQINYAIGWHTSRGTPDYFNSCAPYGNDASEPYNYFGYQIPASGNAYTGFYAKAVDVIYREYIESQLLSPLQSNAKYYVSIKVSLANGYNCAVNKLGVLFTMESHSYSNPCPICNCAQIYTDSIIADTTNWVMIKGSFIADSNYTYINLGNFFNDSLTDTTKVSQCQSYYYLDDICVSTDSEYCYNYQYVGINNFEPANSVKYYPNPFKDFITIENIENNVKAVRLYDIYGQLLKTQELNDSHDYIMDLVELPKGIYIITFYGQNLYSSNHTIIKL